MKPIAQNAPEQAARDSTQPVPQGAGSFARMAPEAQSAAQSAFLSAQNTSQAGFQAVQHKAGQAGQPGIQQTARADGREAHKAQNAGQAQTTGQLPPQSTFEGAQQAQAQTAAAAARHSSQAQTALYANEAARHAFSLLVTQFKLLSEDDFLKLHAAPVTDPKNQKKTLEIVSLSLIPTNVPNAPFFIERSALDKQIKVSASPEFKDFILRYSAHLQALHQKHLEYNQPDERFWALLACAAAANLTHGLNSINAQFLVSDEFKTVRGMVYELSRKIGYEQSGQQKELDDFFNPISRQNDLLKTNQDSGFIQSKVQPYESFAAKNEADLAALSSHRALRAAARGAAPNEAQGSSPRLAAEDWSSRGGGKRIEGYDSNQHAQGLQPAAESIGRRSFAESVKSELPKTQLLPDYTQVVNCDSNAFSSPFCVGEGPDLDDFFDQYNDFVAVRSVNSFSCGVLDGVVRGMEQFGYGGGLLEEPGSNAGGSFENSLEMQVKDGFRAEKQRLATAQQRQGSPQDYSRCAVQIGAEDLCMFRKSDKILKNSGVVSSYAQYSEPAQTTKRFAEQLWSVQVLARHVWNNVASIRSKKTFEDYKAQVAKCIEKIESEYAGNEFNTFVERSTIDAQIGGVRALLGIF